MKLDFSLLTQPMQKRGGHVGHGGHPVLTRVPASPKLSPVTLNEGDTRSGLEASTEFCPPLSPACPPPNEALKTNVYEGVPSVPFVPLKKSLNLEHLRNHANCYVHGDRVQWWNRADGSAVCGLCHPDPFALAIRQAKTAGPPEMPEGVRLLEWNPLRPPVAIARWAVITDIPLFIQATLRQLEAAIAGKEWLAGNWSVRELVEGLEQVGVKVELE